VSASVEHFHLLPEDETPSDADAAAPPRLPPPPVGDIVHGSGDKVRKEAQRLAELYRRRRRARLVQLGLVLVGAYLLFFHHTDDER